MIVFYVHKRFLLFDLIIFNGSAHNQLITEVTRVWLKAYSAAFSDFLAPCCCSVLLHVFNLHLPAVSFVCVALTHGDGGQRDFTHVQPPMWSKATTVFLETDVITTHLEANLS